MTGWARTGDGWALNLDGSDSAAGFSLPRLEIHASSTGWECVCHLADGTSRRPRCHANSTSAAKRAVLSEARSALGPGYVAVLDELLASS